MLGWVGGRGWGVRKSDFLELDDLPKEDLVNTQILRKTLGVAEQILTRQTCPGQCALHSYQSGVRADKYAS